MKVVICSSNCEVGIGTNPVANLAISNGLMQQGYNPLFDGSIIPIPSNDKTNSSPFAENIWIMLVGHGEYTDKQMRCLESIISLIKESYGFVTIHRAEEFFICAQSISRQYCKILNLKYRK